MAAGTLEYDASADVDGAVLRLRSGDTDPAGPLLVEAGPDPQGRATSVGGMVRVRRHPQGFDEAKTYVRLQATEQREGRVRVYGDPNVPGAHDWTGQLAQDAGTDAYHARRSGHVVLRAFNGGNDPVRTARLGGRERPAEAEPTPLDAERVAGRRGDLKLYDAGALRAQLWIDDQSNGRLSLRDSEGVTNATLGYREDLGGTAVFLRGAAGNAIIGASDFNGGFIKLTHRDGYEIRIDSDGIAIANLLKDRFLNSFVAAHPDDPSLEIRYTVLEGPEPGTYVRGSAHLVDGRATVALPDHFRHVTAAQGLTVQLTPRSARSKGVCASRLTLTDLVIEELADGHGEYEVDYHIHGVRRGFEAYEVIRRAPPDIRARSAGQEEG